MEYYRDPSVTEGSVSLVTERKLQTNNKYLYFTLKFPSQGWRLTDSPDSIAEGAEEVQEGCRGTHPEAQTCAVLHLPSLGQGHGAQGQTKPGDSTAVSQCGSSGHMELGTHTRAVLMLFPSARAFPSTRGISDCEHRTDLGSWHSKGSQQKEQSAPALLCPCH